MCVTFTAMVILLLPLDGLLTAAVVTSAIFTILQPRVALPSLLRCDGPLTAAVVTIIVLTLQYCSPASRMYLPLDGEACCGQSCYPARVTL